MNVQDLIDTLTTKQEADNLCQKLESIKYQAAEGKSLKKIIIDALPFLKDSDIDLSEKVHAFNVIDELKQRIKKTPVFKLTIANDLQQQIISDIADQLQKNYGQRVFIDLEKDEGVIGGAVVEFAGYHKDYSVRAQLEAYFNKHI